MAEDTNLADEVHYITLELTIRKGNGRPTQISRRRVISTEEVASIRPALHTPYSRRLVEGLQRDVGVDATRLIEDELFGN